MSTIKDMSLDYVNSVYELSIFLRLNGHNTLGERLVTAAVDLATLSHTSWTTTDDKEFLTNLTKTHETADKLVSLINIVTYLELGYSGLGKVSEDTQAIFKMSKSSLNTFFTRHGIKVMKKTESAGTKEDQPSQQLKSRYTANQNDIKQEIAQEGNNTVPDDNSPDKEDNAPQDQTNNGLPFETGQDDSGVDQIKDAEEMSA